MKALVLLLQYLLLLWPSHLPGVLSNDRVVHAPNHTNVEVGCVPSEREALIRFKRRLVDPTEQLLSWSEGDCCRWKGVGCDNQTGHVVMLDLHNNVTSLLHNVDYTSALSGEIDPSLLHLRHLQHLDLSGNNLSSSSIPTFIGSFKKMRYLNLSGTDLLGTIPVQLGNLSNLQSLDLSYNLGLVLDNGGLLGRLSSLQHLDMTGVDLGSSGFEWLSNIWKMTPYIKFLSLTANNFGGTFPSSLCKLDLERTDLSTNHFSGKVPGCLMNVRSYLNLASNNLHGSFPTLVDSQCSLKSLHLDDNNLSGNLPISLRSCSQMTILDLGENNFTGNIPTWLVESMVSLKILRLRSNKFLGNIPPSLSNLTSLQILDLSNNNLVGRIPSTFGNFVAMMSKHMIYESMGYYKPETISVVTKGKYMSYTGLLPLVTSMDLSSNELTEEIPQELGRLLFLVNLNLSGNHLTRNIPETISSLQSLETLDLSRNDLSGGIPQSMSKMTSLNHLNLSFNNLSGKIPTNNQFQTFIDPSIFLGNPGLCGSPLKDCDSVESSITKSTSRQHKDDHQMLWLYLSTVLGFIVGFWAFYGTLIFKKAWRYSYFQFVDDMNKLFYIRCNRLVKKMFK